MGITKIKAVKDSLSRIVGYAENPEKTHYSDMQQVLHYADNQEKVSMEQTMYVTGLHCRREQAYEDMMYTKRHFNKTGGNVAYHCIQSFKTGEVTPELCHQLGVELAQRMWGDRFQVLVATHFNTGTYHNHLVINSVSYKDGKKFNCNQKAFYQMREISDQLCREHNLTVIEHPSGKTPRNIYFAEKQGKPTTFGLMRQAIDEAVGISWSWFDFCQVMKQKGYLINASPHRKYATIRAIGAKKAVRMVRLGEEYDHRRIIQRIDTMDYREKEACGQAYQQVRRSLSQPPRRVNMAGSFHSAKKDHRPEGAVSPLLLFPGDFSPRRSDKAVVARDAAGGDQAGTAVPPDRADSPGTSEQRAGCGGLSYLRPIPNRRKATAADGDLLQTAAVSAW
ncbi:relaxase/mobilization nuclease domain-containing protein [Flavonifractor plautii]|uniref:relaxase/mobilization nuclease domain-containing protein n=1 Tax=Flavonifractor plautii TaxID=292800 RepID=UPI0018AA3B5B|nr:relaxase/mobilization nuclease domain-containing protein [Flavonifractor plautii]MDB7866381.1 relaxase/mobilization nuclease domain-containing protein [Flavonifractor plautii]MDB7870455.1 relaxase/mobilization nuclease domain-containing protein [Flavonifractor plautii]MDB7882809.1 relaxase/mobilization nuclease domain-containing protein [Flavonifractor plautii]